MGIVGCAASPKINNLQDGDVALPKNFEAWPQFIVGIEKSNGQVRDIYVNDVGTAVKKNQAFPNGTQFVMTIHDTQDDGYGGKEKSNLATVFVMSKGTGNGTEANINNGEWAYAAYNGKGELIEEMNYDTCRGCHAPLADKDFIFHYDQYFDQNASLHGPSYASVLDVHAAL